jgi:hypothetical protein
MINLVAQFSFSRLRGADPVLGVEMKSTGEVACFGANRYEAFLKALLSTGITLGLYWCWKTIGFKIPKKSIFISIGAYKEKLEFLPFAKKLAIDMKYTLFGSRGTADFISSHDIPITTLDWPDEASKDYNIEDYFLKSNIDLVINCPSGNERYYFQLEIAYLCIIL